MRERGRAGAGAVAGLQRSSVRSRSSRGSVGSKGSSSSTASDPRERVKDCCRKVVAFMCTQVGVGGLVVGYAIVGAFGFQAIENSLGEYPERAYVLLKRNMTAQALWRVSQELNVLNESAWRRQVNATLVQFQHEIVKAVRMGYSGRDTDEWSYPAALMFCLSIFTMIGFGNLVPRTVWGKAATVVYAVFGVPLYVLYFMNMGKVLAQSFRWIYTKLYECSTERPAGGGPRPRVVVPSTACLWVIGGYVLTGTIMFGQWEGWSYLDSCYFCVTSLCKIGFGDFVPGATITFGNSSSAAGHHGGYGGYGGNATDPDAKTGQQARLVINFVYLLLGLGLIAMCYNLMREEVRVKVRQLKDDVGHCLDELHLRAATCYRGPSPEPDDYMYDTY